MKGSKERFILRCRPIGYAPSEYCFRGSVFHLFAPRMAIVGFLAVHAASLFVTLVAFAFECFFPAFNSSSSAFFLLRLPPAFLLKFSFDVFSSHVHYLSFSFFCHFSPTEHCSNRYL